MRVLVKKYWITIVVICVAIAAAVGFAVYTQAQTNAAIALAEKSLHDDRARHARLLAELHKKRAEAEAKAQKAAEAKKKAAAKKKQAAPAPTSTPAVPSQGSAAQPHRNPASIDIVVNKKHPLIPQSYAPPLVTVACAGSGSTTISPLVRVDFDALCQAAKKAGVPLATSSSYRSYQTQVNTYNYWVSVSGRAGADRYSARPGYSEHQTGLAVDFQVPGGASLSNFTGTPQQKWLAKNARKYGFIQRYTTANSQSTGYDAESWHYRYIGRAHAASYISSGAGSLETFWGIAGGNY